MQKGDTIMKTGASPKQTKKKISLKEKRTRFYLKRMRIFTFLLAFAMVFILPVADPGSQSYAASRTPDEAIAWAQSMVGQSIETNDPSNMYQCVDFIQAYYQYLGVPISYGNGADYASNTLPSGWTRVQGGQPEKGDILVYGPSGSNPFGHVGIYESDYVTYHQNVSGPYVSREPYAYNGFTNPYWGYIRPDFNSFTSKVEEVKGVAGGIYLKGWTFNNNNVTKPTQIHMYLDGSVGSGAPSWAIEADKSRPDVDNYYHVGEFHGFEKTIEGISAGNHTVYLYANDQYLSQHAYIGSYNVTVSGEGPVCSDFFVGELREGAFTVKAKLTDSNGIKDVKYAIWTEKNGQDDIVWYPGYCTDHDDYYWARVNFADHKGEKGTYTIHLYAYDNQDNLTNIGISYNFKETGPTISNVAVSDVTESGYTVTCTVKDELGVLRVQFPTWTEKNGNDDIASNWNTNSKVSGTKSGDKYSFRVNAFEHNNETGNYITHIYAYDKIGNATSYTVPTVKVHNHSWDEGVITKAATCTENGTREKTCAYCGDKVTESINATGHQWNTEYTVDKAATYAEAGSKSIHCSVCNAVKEGSSVSIDKLIPAPAPAPAPAPTPEPAITTTGENAEGTQAVLPVGTVTVTSAAGQTVTFTTAPNKTSVTVPDTVTIDGKQYSVTEINSNAFTGKKIRTVTIGRNVKVIRKNAFKGSPATKLILKTKLLKKAKVKGCLKGSKIKAVQIKAGNKAANKKFVVNYKKIFTKANAGRKVIVK